MLHYRCILDFLFVYVQLALPLMGEVPKISPVL
jgi:hypothetical protein